MGLVSPCGDGQSFPWVRGNMQANCRFYILFISSGYSIARRSIYPLSPHSVLGGNADGADAVFETLCSRILAPRPSAVYASSPAQNVPCPHKLDNCFTLQANIAQLRLYRFDEIHARNDL
jgi:hypothetical protein